MPTLWLPGEDPWQFRRLPFLADPELRDLTLRDAFNFIEKIPSEVLNDTEIDPSIKLQVKEGLVRKWRRHYRVVSLLLHFHELNQVHLLPKILPVVHLKPYSDFSISRLRFLERVSSSLQHFQNLLSCAGLWLGCEISDFEYWVQLSGITGSPLLDKENRVFWARARG